MKFIQMFVLLVSLAVSNITVLAANAPQFPFPSSLPVGSEEAIIEGLLPQTTEIRAFVQVVDVGTNLPPSNDHDSLEWHRWVNYWLFNHQYEWSQIIGTYGEYNQTVKSPDQVRTVAQNILNELGDVIEESANDPTSKWNDHMLVVFILGFENKEDDMNLLGVYNYFLLEKSEGKLTVPQEATVLNIRAYLRSAFKMPEGVNRAVYNYDYPGDQLEVDSLDQDQQALSFRNGYLLIDLLLAANGAGVLTLYSTNGVQATYDMANGQRLLPLTIKVEVPGTGDIIANSVGTAVTIVGSPRPVVLEYTTDFKTWKQIAVVGNHYGTDRYQDTQRRLPTCFYRVRYSYE